MAENRPLTYQVLFVVAVKDLVNRQYLAAASCKMVLLPCKAARCDTFSTARIGLSGRAHSLEVLQLGRGCHDILAHHERALECSIATSGEEIQAIVLHETGQNMSPGAPKQAVNPANFEHLGTLRPTIIAWLSHRPQFLGQVSYVDSPSLFTSRAPYDHT